MNAALRRMLPWIILVVVLSQIDTGLDWLLHPDSTIRLIMAGVTGGVVGAIVVARSGHGPEK